MGGLTKYFDGVIPYGFFIVITGVGVGAIQTGTLIYFISMYIHIYIYIYITLAGKGY
jgi:hypothetical protein